MTNTTTSKRRIWQPMVVTHVGNLSAVMQVKSGACSCRWETSAERPLPPRPD